jgi:prepilin-type N-terminal cleavage/methylation domain-containing protein
MSAKRPLPRDGRRQSGFTLIEVLAAVILLSVALLALGAVAGQSLKRSALSAGDLQVLSDVTRISDSLTVTGWGAVTNGTEAHAHHKINWNVTTVSADLDRVDLVVQRLGALATSVVEDTMTLYLSNPTP